MHVAAAFIPNSTVYLGEENGPVTFTPKLTTLNAKLHSGVIQWT